jgi:hypothetical protein
MFDEKPSDRPERAVLEGDDSDRHTSDRQFDGPFAAPSRGGGNTNPITQPRKQDAVPKKKISAVCQCSA